jgi:adenine-specific DNA-methyltransferase
MNYIGSKHKLSGFIFDSVTEVVGEDLSQKTCCDLFAGTGIVGRTFKPHVKKLISNDIEFYSYVLNRNYIGIGKEISSEERITQLNALEGKKGFVFEEYSKGGKAGRNYFTSENGQKIDAIRSQIESWKQASEINEDEYYHLLTALLEGADRIANTASIYGAYLKKIKASAARQILLKPSEIKTTKNIHEVYQEDSNTLIKRISGDVLYLDPPYNARQYGANYHILNTIAKYDTFVPKGKTGLPNYYKSDYCSKKQIKNAFAQLIEDAQFPYIFLSYNNEGLMSPLEVRSIMDRFGKYSLVTKQYRRFKADKTENRNHKASETLEFLHILEKQ